MLGCWDDTSHGRFLNFHWAQILNPNVLFVNRPIMKKAMEEQVRYIPCATKACKRTTETVSLRSVENTVENPIYKLYGYFCPDCLPHILSYAEVLQRADMLHRKCDYLEAGYVNALLMGDERTAQATFSQYERLSHNIAALLTEWALPDA